MRTRSIGQNIVLMAIFISLALFEFSENVRAVQILGLFACGAASGIALMRIIVSLKAKKEIAQPE